MPYQVKEDYLPLGRDHNRPGAQLEPVGVVIHETATPNATAENESAYFHSGYVAASAHYFVDHDSIIRIIPENERAWHAGPNANQEYLSMEMCHFVDPVKFAETWNRSVWLIADMCTRYGWNPDKDIVTHAWVSKTWPEDTDHMDPIDYFKDHGKTVDDFINDVKQEMASKPLITKELIMTVTNFSHQQIPTVVIDGKGYVGAREISEILGKNITWDQETQEITIA